MSALCAVVQPNAWRAALEKYAAATGITVAVYEAPARLILGPLHPAPLFQTVNRGRDDPVMFSSCAEECLTRTDSPIVTEAHGVAVIASALRLDDQAVGAVVAGYGLTAFPDEAAVRRFTLRFGLPFLPAWREIRRQAPLTPPRIRMYADLLAALAETLLSENARAQAFELTSARLAQMNQAKDQFLAMLAHEIRNPLAPIQIAMRVVSAGEPSTPQVQQAREIIDRQVRHLTRLLDDLLDVARITTGKIALRKDPVNLAVTVANALEASRSLLDQRGHAVSVSLPESPVFVEADPIRLEQVITNLVNNAARYTPSQGHINVTACRENEEAVIRVRDDGIGISPELMSQIFDVFAQGDRSLARTEGGLGIGLTVVRSLVELHGGTVTVQSEGPGQGSEFVVRLPLGSQIEAPSPPPPAARGVIRPLRVLLIEDHADNLDALQTFLRLDGHRVEAARDGLTGVEMARAARPEVAFIDIGLPGLNGYEVGRQIRRSLGISVMLCALTGYGRPEDVRSATEAGFDVYLVKPVTPEALRDILARRAAGPRMPDAHRR